MGKNERRLSVPSAPIDLQTRYESFGSASTFELSPRHLDSVLAGLGLALTCLALHGADIALGSYAPPFFAVPCAASGLLFFAGPVPPPPRAFVFCTGLAWVCGCATVLLPFGDPASKAALLAGTLLVLFKLSNNFFVPTLGLAAALLTDPTGQLQASPLLAIRFLIAPWLLGHSLLYVASCLVAMLRKRVRILLSKQKLKQRFANMGDSDLREVFRRYDTSGDGYLQAGELKFAWQAGWKQSLTAAHDGRHALSAQQRSSQRRSHLLQRARLASSTHERTGMFSRPGGKRRRAR